MEYKNGRILINTDKNWKYQKRLIVNIILVDKNVPFTQKQKYNFTMDVNYII